MTPDYFSRLIGRVMLRFASGAGNIVRYGVRRSHMALEAGGLPQPPRGWSLQAEAHRALLTRAVVPHSTGSSETPVTRTVAVAVSASNRRDIPRLRRERNVERSLRARGRRNVLPASDELSEIPTLFSFVITPASDTDGRSLGGCASCVGDGVCFDSLFFVKSPEIMLEPGVESARLLSDVYQGPSLNQRLFAESVVNACGVVAPTAPLRQREEFAGNPHFDPINLFTKYGHYPAHTIATPLYGAIVKASHAVGINDDFAVYVRQLEAALRHRAVQDWRQQILPLLERVPNP
jgi:hypothetical protein